MANARLYQLNHCTYICQYHLVWATKYRGKILADKYIKRELKQIFKQIASWKGFQIYSWHVGDEHVHLVIQIPPKFSVSYAAQILKGKSSAWIKKKTKKFPRGTLWVRGYYVSTVGLDEMTVRHYVDDQSHHQVELPKLPL